MPALLKDPNTGVQYRQTIPTPDDPTVYEPICQALAKGHPHWSAAALAGISDQTLSNWHVQGLAELAAANDHTPWEELGSHARLVVRMKAASAGLVDEVLDKVRAGGKDWVAWMTLAERRFPADFGKNQRLEVTTTTTVHVTVSQYPPEVLAFLGQQLLAAASEERSPTLYIEEGGGTDVTSPPGGVPDPDPTATP